MTTYLSPGVYTKETDFSYYVKQISTSACGMVGIAEKGPINQPVLVTSWEQFTRKFGSYIPDGYLAYAARSFFDNGGQVLYVNRIAHLTDPSDRTKLAAKCAAITVKGRTAAVAASVVTGTAGKDRITWRAKTSGAAGNAITITLTKGANGSPFSIQQSSAQTLAVTLATDSLGNVTTTVPQLLTNISESGFFAAVDIITSDTGTLAPVAATHLAGGQDPQDALKVRALSEGKWGNNISVEIADATSKSTTEYDLTIRFRGDVVESFRNLSVDETKANHAELLVNGKSEYVTVDDLSAMANTTADKPTVGTYALTLGDDGMTGLLNVDYIGFASEHTGLHAFDEIDGLNVILAPGVTTEQVIAGGLAYAESRKDAIFLAEAPLYLEPIKAVDFRKGQNGYSHAAFNSSYGALYYPWLEITDPLTGAMKMIPPTGAVAGCMARSDEKTEVWYAPAGIDRGRIFGALGLSYNTTRGERDVLYAEGINVIASFPDTGINIWGQKTLQSQPSATDRINVRRLMMYVEKAISESSRFVVFEPNNPKTWRALVRLMDPFLRGIKGRGGFYDYRIQCDEETNTPEMIDRNQMVARVFVKPTKTAEFVELSFVLTATGALFREI